MLFIDDCDYLTQLITASESWCRSLHSEYQSAIRNTVELRQRLVDMTWAEFQQSVVDDVISPWCKRLGACIREDGSHFEHLGLLWRYLPDIQCHNSLPALFTATSAIKQLAFSEPPTFGGKRYTFREFWDTGHILRRVQDIRHTTFTVYVTACDLEKSFRHDITGHVRYYIHV